MSQAHYPPYPPPSKQYYPPQQPQYNPPPQTSGAYSGNQYQPPTYEHNYGREEYYGQANSGVAEKWAQEPKFRDLWALLLFIIHLAGFVVLSYIGITEILNKKKQQPNSDPFSINNDNSTGPSENSDIGNIINSPSIVPLLVIVGIFGFVLSLLYMFLMQRFPKPLIRITLYLSIALFFLIAAVYAYFRAYIAAVILAVFGIFYLICAFTWRDRIPFAAVMLETVTSLTKKYYGTIIIGFAGLIMQVAWSVLWIVTLVGTINKFSASSECQGANCKQPTLYIIVVYLAFSFYWTSQVIKTIIHVTDAGVFATYYFLEGTPQGTGSVPTLSSLKRACTTSIGSICFGSLIIAALNTVRFILRTFESEDNGICGLIACCLECLLSWIENLVEYFNRYAYVQVAIYGKSYCQSAKDTWRLIRDRGVEAIINDNLVGNVLTMGAIFIGAICALFGFGYIRLILKLTTDGTTTFILVLICFFLGFVMALVVLDVIDSGVSTTFVALAEDPDALRRTKPELFEKIRRRWPRVVQGVH